MRMGVLYQRANLSKPGTVWNSPRPTSLRARAMTFGPSPGPRGWRTLARLSVHSGGSSVCLSPVRAWSLL